ncbi:hypothetical protein PRUB_a1409 [Pseudoalteromonas rubra]|uniref:Uncharacterized protein n=1 Tax=Pseudoalteromonas rubra TaxID=43658 RepID=A0A8T0C7L8_9GAMM|nr:hypothetical protein PRUB_a1409 [Pseudoalteromonas rubra]
MINLFIVPFIFNASSTILCFIWYGKSVTGTQCHRHIYTHDEYVAY